jgi:hypothetical protein
VIGDFADCRCSGFNMSFKVELLIKLDPTLSAGGLDSVVLICDRCDSKGSVYNTGQGVVILLPSEVHHF